MPACEVALPLRIGTRTVWTLKRRLVRRRLSLAEALAGEMVRLPELGPEAQGYLVNAVPAAAADALRQSRPDLAFFVRQRYARSYARLDLGFEAYLDTFSAKSRSTLRRKARKLAERCGGRIDLRVYRTEAEIEEFHRLARAVSALTYQEQRLGAGLPDGPEVVAAMRALARRGSLRAWLLFVNGRPASYLYAPAEGGTLIYAYLGYDPEFAPLSVGSVLQFEAMRELMEEGEFELFDFTEGDGQHKRLFATGELECVDLLLVRRTPVNLAVGFALTGFDAAISQGKTMLRAIGAESLVRRSRR